MTEQMYNVGKIINTHGIRGEVKVLRITDINERFNIGNTLYVINGDKKDAVPLVIKKHRQHKKFDLIQFEDHKLIEDVEPFKGCYLAIKAEQLTDLPKHEYYHHDIIGCEMVTTTGESLGKITSIISPGANDVWVVETPQKKEILIPAIKDVVKEIKLSEKQIVVELLEGLLD